MERHTRVRCGATLAQFPFLPLPRRLYNGMGTICSVKVSSNKQVSLIATVCAMVPTNERVKSLITIHSICFPIRLGLILLIAITVQNLLAFGPLLLLLLLGHTCTLHLDPVLLDLFTFLLLQNLGHFICVNLPNVSHTIEYRQTHLAKK